jgi:hypothetical protein
MRATPEARSVPDWMIALVASIVLAVAALTS